MKTLVAVALMLIASVAWAAGPYVESDPYPEASKFRMRIDSGEWVENAPVNQKAKFDVGGLAVGTYKGEIQAGVTEYELTEDATGNVTTAGSAWTESATYTLKKSRLKAPTGLKITE